MKRSDKHLHEVVFGSIEAFLNALEKTEVLITKITQSVIPPGRRGTGVSQRQYAIHLTSYGPVHGSMASIYYCTIFVASQSVLANRPFCPPPLARSQHESCVALQQDVYQHLLIRLQNLPNVTRVLEDARILVRAPWIEPVLWSSVTDLPIDASVVPEKE